ncbi:MAG: DUF3035 domain-containing protein [Alphaproteobacteria bacterium]|nr:DUF3035 domain-containing protein [Alphaproteobacteria bacterium]
MQYKWLLRVIVPAAALLLAACSGLGSPDEFSVLKNPPLIIPPEYHLRPPGDDSGLQNTFTPQEIAKRALFGAVPKG